MQNIVYKWDYAAEKRLVKASSTGGHIDGTSISQHDNILAFGDALTSVSFCHLNPKSLEITELGRDNEDHYITSLQMINSTSCLASDLSGNLMTFHLQKQHNSRNATAAGRIHLADMINAIVPETSKKSELSNFIMASTTGSLYSLHQVSAETFKKLKILQKNLIDMVKSIGNIDYLK